MKNTSKNTPQKPSNVTTKKRAPKYRVDISIGKKNLLFTDGFHPLSAPPAESKLKNEVKDLLSRGKPFGRRSMFECANTVLVITENGKINCVAPILKHTWNKNQKAHLIINSNWTPTPYNFEQ